MKSTKKILMPAIIMLAVTLVIATIPTEAHGAIYEDTIRLHILANSDSDEDQALKLSLRDKILEKYSSELKVSESIRDAESKIERLLPEIERFANKAVCELGYSYKCSVRFEDEWFDTREYESFTLPKGEYKSLIIEIGEGEGKNWWCVMFPPMCLDIATESSKSSGTYTKEETTLIRGGRYSVKFKLLELISEVVEKK